MTDREYFTITESPEYEPYMKALCRLSSSFVPELRRKFADQALEKFQNETLRALVLAYGEEIEKLDADRLRDFKWAARSDVSSLEDSCLNRAKHFAATICFFFGV